MDLAAINTPVAALLAGLVTSLHCAGMCGPLACMLAPSQGDRADPTTINSVYHVSRVGGYMMLGAVAGAIGGVPLTRLPPAVLVGLPWLLVLFFVMVALRLDHRLPRMVWLSRWSLRIQARLRGRSRVQVAATMGALTPLLPCGPLYFLVTLSAISGSAVRGAEFMLAFGLGTVPVLWLAQTQFGWVRRRLSPMVLARVQTGLALITALLLSWRLRATLGFNGPSVENFLCL